MKKIVTSIITVLIAISVFGNTPADSVKVYFRVGQYSFDPAFRSNREEMENFINTVSQAKVEDNIKSIIVNGYASPDGTSTVNEKLSLLRCENIADYVARHTGVDRNVIETAAEGIAWNELRRMVEENPNVPQREKVLEILDNTPIWIFDKEGKIISGRKAQLMSLSRGEPYRWMLEHLFPELRNAVGVTIFLKSDHKNLKEDRDIANSDYNNKPFHPLIIDETSPDDAGYRPATNNYPYTTNDTIETNVTTSIYETNENDVPKITKTANDSEAIHRFALKTNLLYDAALLPDLELEWMINKNWSVAINGDLAWWKNETKHKYYNLAMVSAEGRRWFAVKKPWHGFYAGVFAGIGKYDFENKAKGYMGEGAMGGISAGYMFPIGKYFSLEAGLGVGYMHTRYKEYYPVDGHYVYQRTKSLNYFGPLKLKLAIAWRFYNTNKNKPTTAP